MALREIIYLDRVRVESYISQMAGRVTVQESAAASDGEKLSGQIGAEFGFAKFGVSGERNTGGTRTTTTIPAHAVLATLETLLESNGMVVDAGATTVLPGQIATFRGDATFESWGLLASLADSVQGVATLAAKIYSLTQGTAHVKELRQQLEQLEKLMRKTRGDLSVGDVQTRLSSGIKAPLVALSIVDGKYINDVKDVVKLFFQDQNHIRLASRGKTFVGLLRRDSLVGSTMEEMLFDYGSAPKASFGALFYLAEFGHAETIVAEEFKARMAALGGRPVSFSLVQEAIREVGTILLQLAEELRRPIGENAAFMIPLAVYREIRGKNDAPGKTP